MGGGAHAAEPVGNVIIGIGVGVEMHQRHLLAAGELCIRARNRLQDRAGDGVIAADGDRPHAGFVQSLIIGLDMLHADVVDHRLRQRHVAEIVDPAFLPGVEVEQGMAAPVPAGHVAQKARRQVLVALGGTVAGAVGHADEADIRRRQVFIPGRAEESGDAEPIPAAGLRLHPLIGRLIPCRDGRDVVHVCSPGVCSCCAGRLARWDRSGKVS
jgi:hypothetical protein